MGKRYGVLLSFISVLSLALAGAAWTQGFQNKPKRTYQHDWPQYKRYIDQVSEALGTFRDIEVWHPKQDGKDWELANGAYIPILVDGKVPETYEVDMLSDRPMVLPVDVFGYHGGEGQSLPYTVVGRMPGSNPETQWVFLVRKYHLRHPHEADFDKSGDIAVIGHHPRTGESTYFQFLDPENPKPSRVVVSPFSGERGMRFWAPLEEQAEQYNCQACHNTDPFIHTPWIDQVRVRPPKAGEPFPEPMVPSDPLGSFSFIDSDEGGLFHSWNEDLVHMDNAENKCTACHRVSPIDTVGFYLTSTDLLKDYPKHQNPYAALYEGGLSDRFKGLPWMPPVNTGDFYAGQKTVKEIWKEIYEPSAKELLELTFKWNDSKKHPLPPKDREMLSRVPSVPKEYRKIVVDRPNHDRIPTGEIIWIVDTRMRANTDGKLADWRFFGNERAGQGLNAIPVVLKKDIDSNDDARFRIVHIGDARTIEDAGKWVPFVDGTHIDLKQGHYLGLMLVNTQGSSEIDGLVPYTNDHWINPVWSDGTPNYVDGLVTRKLRAHKASKAGEVLTFEETAYQTYSFEMRNKF